MDLAFSQNPHRAMKVGYSRREAPPNRIAHHSPPTGTASYRSAPTAVGAWEFVAAAPAGLEEARESAAAVAVVADAAVAAAVAGVGPGLGRPPRGSKASAQRPTCCERICLAKAKQQPPRQGNRI